MNYEVYLKNNASKCKNNVFVRSLKMRVVFKPLNVAYNSTTPFLFLSGHLKIYMYLFNTCNILVFKF